MPVAQRRHEHDPQVSSSEIQVTRTQQISSGPSPALTLQRQLEHHHQIAGELQKWSPRRAMAFIVTASAALWMAILVASAEVVKAVA